MAGEGYQVTKAIEEEKEAVRRVTAEIERLKSRKSADTTAIRSWRFKYMNWRSRVVLIDHTQAEDQQVGNRRRVRAYNRLVERLASGITVTSDNFKRIEGMLGRLQKVADDLQQAGFADQVAGKLSMTTEQLEEAQGQLDEFSQKQKELDQRLDEFMHADDWYSKANEAVISLNSNSYETKVAEFDEKMYEVRVNQDGITDLAYQLIQTYKSAPQYGVEGAMQTDLWSKIGTPDFSTIEESFRNGDDGRAEELLSADLYRLVEARLEEVKDEQASHYLREYGSSVPSDEVEPVALIPFTGAIDYEEVARKARHDGAEKSLVEEMDDFASGGYDHTRGHFDDINALAIKIGHNCPKIEEVATTFSTSRLIPALEELEATWSSFGGQRNSGEGEAIVSKFKNTVSNLEGVQSYHDLDRLARRFSTQSTQLFIWLESKWWQNGGTPGGDAHAWKPTKNVIVLK